MYAFENRLPEDLPKKAVKGLSLHRFGEGEIADLLECGYDVHAELLNKMEPGEFYFEFYPPGVSIQRLHQYVEGLKGAGLDIGGDGRFGFKMPHPERYASRFLIVYRKR